MITKTNAQDEIFWVDGPQNEMVSDGYFASVEQAIEWANSNLAEGWIDAGYGIQFAPAKTFRS